MSVGLIPENELSRAAGLEMDPRTNGPCVYENMETSVPGVFACGNVVHVHDLVDFVTAESQRAGRAAAAFCAGGRAAATPLLPLKAGNGVGYTVPQQIRMENIGDGVPVFFRVRAVYRDAKIVVRDAEGTQIAAFPREHLAPGEMETIRLPRVLLQKAAGALTVEVEKGGEGA